MGWRVAMSGPIWVLPRKQPSGEPRPLFRDKGRAPKQPARKLLAAAEKTFARDGFEAARLEDIASLAGYTRGAFYANFKSKEDIFFALLEEWVGRRIAEVYARTRARGYSRQALARPARTLRANCERSPAGVALAGIQVVRDSASRGARAIAHPAAASSRLWRRPCAPHCT